MNIMKQDPRSVPRKSSVGRSGVHKRARLLNRGAENDGHTIYNTLLLKAVDRLAHHLDAVNHGRPRHENLKRRAQRDVRRRLDLRSDNGIGRGRHQARRVVAIQVLEQQRAHGLRAGHRVQRNCDWIALRR